MSRRTEVTMFPVIEAWESSPLSREAFCRQHNLTKGTFGYWRSKYLKSIQQPDPLFSEIEPNFPTNLELTYPNGVKLTLPSNTCLSLVKSLIAIHV